MTNPFGNRGALTFSEIGLLPRSMHGKRVRMTVWVKTRGIENWAGLQFGMFTAGNRIAVYDMMGSRPIHGTTDWTQYALVEDVPEDVVSVTGTATIYDGAGEMWFDDVRIEEVPTSVATTDDTAWHRNGPTVYTMSTALDPAVARNGHPTMCITATDPVKNANRGNTYGYVIRQPEQYVGKRVRLSVWLKANGATNNGYGPFITARGPTDKVLARPTQMTPMILLGTMDWTLCTTEFDVPANTMNVSSFIYIVGSGKVWMDDFKLEVVGDNSGL